MSATEYLWHGTTEKNALTAIGGGYLYSGSAQTGSAVRDFVCLTDRRDIALYYARQHASARKSRPVIIGIARSALDVTMMSPDLMMFHVPYGNPPDLLSMSLEQMQAMSDASSLIDRACETMTAEQSLSACHAIRYHGAIPARDLKIDLSVLDFKVPQDAEDYILEERQGRPVDGFETVPEHPDFDTDWQIDLLYGGRFLRPGEVVRPAPEQTGPLSLAEFQALIRSGTETRNALVKNARVHCAHAVRIHGLMEVAAG